MRPVIAFLTDFGTADPYVGTMKAVTLGICPDATLVDITHHVPPHDIVAGALTLGASYEYFPDGTVFVVVIDPGVGSMRRGIAVKTERHAFVAPDNGVLTPVLADGRPRVVALSERRYTRPTVSRTFEGRDRFAPAAAWLATGMEVSALGPHVADPILLDLPVPAITERSIDGEVLRVDRFGNLITNIDRAAFERFGGGNDVAIQIGDGVVARLVQTYADIPPETPCALFSSTDHLEIAVNGGSAARLLGLGTGAKVAIRRP